MTETTSCPTCGTHSETRTCVDCGMTATVIDCGHYQQPAAIAASKRDGAPVCAPCEAVRDAEADTASVEDVMAAFKGLTRGERKDVGRAATATLDGIGASEAESLLSERAARLCRAAVPVWCRGVSDIWMSASATADGEAEPTTATLDELVADDDELSGLQMLVLATGDRQVATDLQTALDREAK